MTDRDDVSTVLSRSISLLGAYIIRQFPDPAFGILSGK